MASDPVLRPDPPTLLGGLTIARFMRHHWQRRPLCVRGAWPGVQPPVSLRAMWALAGRDDVESRVVSRQGEGRWSLRHGPFTRHRRPPAAAPGWTLLVQGLDLHVDAARRMLDAFRFVPDARMDDLMVSYATDGGGVGAHQDAYDVFLLQVAGRRRWRHGPVVDATLEPDRPVKLLAHFEPTDDVVLEPGDMLYLPPGWGHDGVAVGDGCMTCSIGLRAPTRHDLLAGLLEGVLEGWDEACDEAWTQRRHADAPSSGTATPGRIPPDMTAFAQQAVARLVRDEARWARALGEWLTAPKPTVWFDAPDAPPPAAELVARGVRLDRRTRALYDARHLYVNGESYTVGGRDATLLRRLADARRLPPAGVAALGDDARAALQDWAEAGWLHPGMEG